MARESSPTRVLMGPEASELASPSLLKFGSSAQWSTVMGTALKGWQSWELPGPVSVLSSKSLLCSDGESGGSACLESLALSHQGTGASLLSLLGTFPSTVEAWTAATSHAFQFFLWDNWLRNHGKSEEFKEFAEFLGDLERSAMPAQSLEATVVDGRNVFPVRLDRKYPGKRRSFVAAVHSLAAIGGEGECGGWWLRRYLREWRVYASNGLELQSQLIQQCADGKTPALDAFLECKALTCGACKWLLLAAHNRGLAPLDEETHDALLPLLAMASMALALHNDVVLFAKSRQKNLSSLNSAVVYDHEQATLVYNLILGLFVEERASLLDEGRWLSGEQRRRAQQVVEVIESSMYGIHSWHKIVLRRHNREVKGTALYEEDCFDLSSAPSWMAPHIRGAVASVVRKVIAASGHSLNC